MIYDFFKGIENKSYKTLDMRFKIIQNVIIIKKGATQLWSLLQN